MTADIQLNETQQAYKWMLNFCLKSSIEAFQNGDSARAEAFSCVAIAVNECLQEQKLVEEAMNA